MSSVQGVAGGAVMLAAVVGAGIEAVRPTLPPPPVVITDLRWTGERVVYARTATRETLAAWSAVVLTEDREAEICDGAGRATYHRGAERHEWSLDMLTGDEGCGERIPPGAEVYVLVTVTPLNGLPPYSKRSGPFRVK